MQRAIEYQCYSLLSGICHGWPELVELNKIHLLANPQPNYPCAQFTGLFDSGGIKIFEGDIYAVEGYGVCHVVIEPLYGVCFRLTDGGQMTMLNILQLELEIKCLGNIFQHKELLDYEN